MRRASTFVLVALTLLLPARPGAAQRWTVETGLQVGDTWDVTGPSHSTVRVVGEFGYLFPRPGVVEPRWSWGVVAYAALGGDDFVMALKPRLRWEWARGWSSDLTAGYLFATLEGDPRVSGTGFAGGLTLNPGRYLTLKGDVNIRHVDAWQTTVRNVPQLHPGGTEVALYGGVSLRERPGWMATGVAILSFAGLMLLVLAGEGGS